MSGRGRGRGAARQSPGRVTAAPSRRVTRHQEPQIDPAITQTQDAQVMGPPPPSVTKSLRSQVRNGESAVDVPRRGTRREVRAESMASIHSALTMRDTSADLFPSHPDMDILARSDAPLQEISSSVRERDTAFFPTDSDVSASQQNARSKLMKAFLQRLFTAADDLFTHLCDEDADGTEVWEAELQGYKVAFHAYRLPYVSDNSSPVITPSFVYERMGAEKGTPLFFEASKIISAANLAALLDEITHFDPADALQLRRLLQSWDSSFPGFFVPEEPGNHSVMSDDDIVEQVLQIRVQLLILDLRAERTKVSAPLMSLFFALANRIFFEEEISADDMQMFLAGGDDSVRFKPVAHIDLNGSGYLRERYATRIRAIYTFFHGDSDEDFSAAMGKVEEDQRLDDCLKNLRKFAEVCFDRIKATLQRPASSAAYMVSLAQYPAPGDGSRAESHAQSQLESEAMAPPFDSSRPRDRSLEYLLPLREQRSQEGGVGLGSECGPLSASARDIVEASSNPQFGAYPPSSSIPYPQAVVSEDQGVPYTEPESPIGYPTNGSIYAQSAAAAVTGTKRPATEETEDDEYQTDSRAPAKKRKIANKPRAARKPAILPPPLEAPPSSTTMVASQYPALPSAQMTDDGDLPDFEALAQRSREISAAHRKPKEPQTRTAWTRNDIRQLVKAVDTYKCKWSVIEREIRNGTIQFERQRDQQALRDKARLLKQDFLKADGILPPSFDLVVLGKKERNAVIACGKNPDRKEADIINGQVINTEYQEEEVSEGVAVAQM
ncbi:hypothetical protein QBC46DRAFT_340023 [Diplogelasinospora grovesii]|uniref:Myb-like domain-containing protein n=1 Tax=Diplogelasinospora grovesii TaxID=303347 RepID=A0AAN6NB04_9PEZI|nr:hypothetical protein QBC46DRAFT_340023 [Diplogelasinospora grovesii]